MSTSKTAEVLDPQTFGNAETAPFWNAAAEDRLLIKQCEDCTAHHWYPRAHCPHCGSAKTRWVESSGTGAVYTFTVLRRGGGQIPCYVTLDEGITIFTNLAEVEPEQVSIGQRVRVRFRAEAGGTKVPVFIPDQDAG